MHIERDMIEKLVNAYFTEIAPILPVITQAEFLVEPLSVTNTSVLDMPRRCGEA